MLSINLIARMAKAERFDSLVEGLSESGLSLPLALRMRLTNAPAAAVAMGLLRVLELTAGPTPAIHALLQLLPGMQAADGSFGRDPIATAAAASAIETAIAQKAVSPADYAQLRDSRFQALSALPAMQDASGLLHGPLDRTGDDRVLTSAFTLWLTGGDEAVRSSLRFAELMTWFESHEDQIDAASDRYWQLAQCHFEYAAATAIEDTHAGSADAVSTSADKTSPRFELLLATAA